MKVIGIGGVAKAGKDSLYRALEEVFKKEGLTCKRYAFADELKKRSREFILAQTGIDLLDCSAEEKEAVRPLMVSFGEVMRTISKGKFWVSHVEDKIARDKFGSHTPAAHIAIITDLRFAEFDEDEDSWVKSQNGKIIHVTRYRKERVNGEKAIIVEPANPTEEKNDPIVKDRSDFQILWPSLETEGERIEFIENWSKLPNLLRWAKV